MPRYYKVVAERGNMLRSVYEHPGAISYTPDQWVSSPAGPLFVFASLRAAREFAHVSGGSVWRCRVRGVRSARKIRVANPYWLPTFSAEKLAAAWRTDPTAPGELLEGSSISVPRNTHLVNAVRLVEEEE